MSKTKNQQSKRLKSGTQSSTHVSQRFSEGTAGTMAEEPRVSQEAHGNYIAQATHGGQASIHVYTLDKRESRSSPSSPFGMPNEQGDERIASNSDAQADLATAEATYRKQVVERYKRLRFGGFERDASELGTET